MAHASTSKYSNHLAETSSPYLLQHVENPVDWYPWGAQALEKAKAENKPIFLSIGYSTCYWCHVMEREVFEHKDVAKSLNKHFISIKVDREERPDIDEIYMLATNFLHGRGGWPNSLFLTPALKPFHAETYIPHGQFMSLVQRLSEGWKQGELQQKAEQTVSRIKSYIAGKQQQSGDALPPENVITNYMQHLARSFDKREGGFGSGTKFPREEALAFLLDKYELSGDNQALEMAQLTLEKMAAGGIHDHIGGGFHRYATDRLWQIPHFEKMLYNQALLARDYTKLFASSNYPHHKDVVEQIFHYVSAEMTAPDGAFYSALDAETDGVEGAYYVWQESELEELLGEELYARFRKIFDMKSLPVFRGHKHTKGKEIFLKKPVMELVFELGIPYAELNKDIAEIRTILLKERNKRNLPRKDNKIITAWNGLMIDAYARAGMALDNADYITNARKAADFILTHLRNDKGELWRIFSRNKAYQRAYAEDYAYFIQGLTSLYQASKLQKYLDEAMNLTAIMDKLFWDKTHGGYYFTDGKDALWVRTKPADDSALPSANAVMAHAMLDLYQLTGDKKWQEKAENILKAFSTSITKNPAGYGHMVHALMRLKQEKHSEILSTEQNISAMNQPSTASKDKVQLSANITNSGEHEVNITVHFKMEDGWHINANPASLEFLIPTSVDAQASFPIDVKTDYPIGTTISSKLGDLSVYENNVSVIMRIISKNVVPMVNKYRILTQFQACKESTCLAPSDIILDIRK